MNHDDTHREPNGGAGTTEGSPLLDERPGTDNHRRRVIIVTFAMFFFLEFGAGLFIPAQTAALEQKICDTIYSNIDPFDRDCKAPDVQGQLADLQGWRTTIDCIPSRLLLLQMIRPGHELGGRQMIQLIKVMVNQGFLDSSRTETANSMCADSSLC
jgi:hypothetical protein